MFSVNKLIASVNTLLALDISSNESYLMKFNQLSETSLAGTIPKTVGQLKSLNIIDLSENRLSGTVPAEIGGITSLMELTLEKNTLTGEIPSSIGSSSSLISL